MQLLSVVVPVYNGEATVGDMLQHLLSLSLRDDIEVITDPGRLRPRVRDVLLRYRGAGSGAARHARERAQADAPSAAVRPVALPPSKYPRIVVLGIDGLDPDILKSVVERFPERMPNFRQLIADGQGVLDLETAIRKCTSLPAKTAGFRQRGVIAEEPYNHRPLLYRVRHRDTSSCHRLLFCR